MYAWLRWSIFGWVIWFVGCVCACASERRAQGNLSFEFLLHSVFFWTSFFGWIFELFSPVLLLLCSARISSVWFVATRRRNWIDVLDTHDKRCDNHVTTVVYEFCIAIGSNCHEIYDSRADNFCVSEQICSKNESICVHPIVGDNCFCSLSESHR